MTQILLLLNAILIFPFGVAAMISPVPLFGAFGVHLDRAGALIARGYASSLIAYGLALFLLRGVQNPKTAKAVLCSLVAFNTAEAIVQGVAGVQGLALPMIFGNVIVHGLMAILCLVTSLNIKAS